jgi:colanic acid/amylovoran biosynthesis glycosyltransferase
LKRHILGSNFLHFAIGGLWGDWASVACLIADRHKLRYAVWTDKVEPEVARFDNQSRSGLRWAYWSFNIAAMKVLERHVIKRGALGLFHGMDCYTACSRYRSNPHFVDDVATNDKDFVSESQPASRFANRNKLLIAYAGRVHRVN